LLQYARLFRATRQAQLSVTELAPVDPAAIDGAWNATWVIRIYGEWGTDDPEQSQSDSGSRSVFPSQRATWTGPLGEVTIRGRVGWLATPSDFENQKQWIASWVIDRTVQAHVNHRLMQDITAQTGIDVSVISDNWKLDRPDFSVTPGGVYACDYDGNGQTDLLLVDKGSAQLYKGLGGGRFEDVTLAAGLQWEPFSGLMAVLADFDNDGDEDLILGESVFENRDRVFLKRGLLGLGSRPAGGSVGDYDLDGLVDVYFSYAAPGPMQHAGRTSWIDDDSGEPNKLYRNLGSFQFEDVTKSAGAAAGSRSTFTSVWLDADDDGWPDIYVINELGSNILLHNERTGRFREVPIGPAFDGFTMGVAAGDLDGDGRIDLYLANMYSKAGQRIVGNIPTDAYPKELLEKFRRFVSGNILLRNRGHLDFVESDSGTNAVGWAYGPGLPDLDADGLLDIHSTCGFASFSRDEPDG
jgi:hypothetical protein